MCTHPLKPLVLWSCLALPAIGQAQQKASLGQPNVVLILCDDMGFSDLSCYGGEIQTPHIDSLARMGVRFSQFKNTGRSCPSRASLLTGYYPHSADLGWMVEVDEHRPGYRGQMSACIPTLAEVMKENGYATYMTGKWHVTHSDSYETPDNSYPLQRGFDKYYGCLSGGGSYYTPTPLYSNNSRIKEYPKDYYYTTAITDSAVSFLRRHPAGVPLFLYVAHYAPHLPLQAPIQRVEKCRAYYQEGFDKVRKARFERQKTLGLVNPTDTLPEYQREFNGKKPRWEELGQSQQKNWITNMATYAAMVELVDDGVGKIMQEVKDKGWMENTLFIFLSDNGATSESGLMKQLMADVSNTPYRNYKQWVHQGGTSSPLIIAKGDRSMQRAGFCTECCHIIDLFPTCLELTSSIYPSTFSGRRVRLQGQSVLPLLKGEHRKKALYFEHQSACAILKDGWKLVRLNDKSKWELYHLTEDVFETNDLSARYPRRVRMMEKQWNRWARDNKVLPLESLPWSERINHYRTLAKEKQDLPVER